ncbi:MAG: hypothetical protein ACR2NU_02225 [Aeoliella sp.]
MTTIISSGNWFAAFLERIERLTLTPLVIDGSAVQAPEAARLLNDLGRMTVHHKQ